jgi:hypothetical protein
VSAGKATVDVPPLTVVRPLEATAYAPVPSGPFDIGVTWFEEPLDCGAALQLDTEPEAPYTMWVAGTHENPVFGYAADDAVGIPVDQTRFGLYNTATGLAEADWLTPSGPVSVPFGSGFVFTTSSDPFELSLDLNDDGYADLVFSLPATPSGTYIPLFLAYQGEDLGLLGLKPNGGLEVLIGAPPFVP